MAKQHHVVPKGDKWAVTTDNAKRASAIFDKKQEAVDYGRDVSRRQGTEFFIHDGKGRIAQRDSHGNDPYPPKG